MSNNDLAVGITSGIPTMGVLSKKPSYLITLEDNTGKNKSVKFFITLDKPEHVSGFVQVKGIFCEKSEADIIKTFPDILTSTGKEAILEMMFPEHKICSIRSLVFKAK